MNTIFAFLRSSQSASDLKNLSKMIKSCLTTPLAGSPTTQDIAQLIPNTSFGSRFFKRSLRSSPVASHSQTQILSLSTKAWTDCQKRLMNSLLQVSQPHLCWLPLKYPAHSAQAHIFLLHSFTANAAGFFFLGGAVILLKPPLCVQPMFLYFTFVACHYFHLLNTVFVLQLKVTSSPLSQISLLVCLLIFQDIPFLCLDGAVLKTLPAFLSRFTLQNCPPLNLT